MLLIDSATADFEGPSPNGMASFEYLRRSNREAAGRVRTVFEEWFKAHPEACKKDLKARFESQDEGQHQGAAFELIACATVRALGCSVDGVKESVSKRGNPDFLVTALDGSRFVLEATVVTGHNSSNLATKGRADRLVDALNRVHSKSFKLEVEVVQAGDREASKRKFRVYVEQWLKRLEVEHGKRPIVESRDEQYEVAGRDEKEAGWVVRLTAHPWTGATDSRPIRSTGWHEVTTTRAVCSKLHGKLNSQLPDDLPYVVAINVLDHGISRIQSELLMFGVPGRAETVAPQGTLQSDGFLWGRNGFRNTSLSGLLVFSNATPWELRSRGRCWGIYNPGASRPVGRPFEGLPCCRLVDGRMGWSDGGDLAGTLGLPPSWPRT